MAYICGQYDKSTRAINGLTLVVLVTEELRDDYHPGLTIHVGSKQYILTDRRFIAPGTVVQYDLVAQKGT